MFLFKLIAKSSLRTKLYSHHGILDKQELHFQVTCCVFKDDSLMDNRSLVFVDFRFILKT